MGLMERDRNSGQKRGNVHEPDLEKIGYMVMKRGNEAHGRTQIDING